MQVMDAFWCDSRLDGMGPESAYLFTTAYDRTLRLWEITTGHDDVCLWKEWEESVQAFMIP